MSANSLTDSEVIVKSSADHHLEMLVTGRLDPATVEGLWIFTKNTINKTKPQKISVDCSRLESADSIGITYFIKIRDLANEYGISYEFLNLSPEYQKLAGLFDDFVNEKVTEEAPSENFVESIGRSTVESFDKGYESVAFMGEVAVGFIKYITHPAKIRYKDILITAEKLGVNALLIIALINFLVGLVIAFQSAIPLSQYGGTIFVADLLVLSVFKELGPFNDCYCGKRPFKLGIRC